MTDHEWWITQLPRLLMATTGVLVEFFFQKANPTRRYTSLSVAVTAHLKDRILVQVLLWLTASLASPQRVGAAVHVHDDDVFEEFLHITFFANLVGITGPFLLTVTTPSSPQRSGASNPEGAIRRYGSLGMCCPRQSTRYETNTWNAGTSLRISMESILTKLPFSLWCSVILSYLEHGQQIYCYVGISGAVLILSFLASWWMQQSRERAKKRSQYLPTILLSTSSRTEEHNWWQWSIPQVSAWLSEVMVDVSDENLRDLTSQLAREAIDGAALDFLDMDALRHMGIPYGIAAKLLVIKAQLSRRYPRPDRPESSSCHKSEGHDSRYNPSQFGRYPGPQDPTEAELNFRNFRFAPHTTQPYLDDEEVEQARSSMMQRFGFHLPELRKNKPGLFRPDDDAEQKSDRPSTVTSMEPSSTTMGDDALLPTMPPHIREILQQKPHLWHQVQAIQERQKDSRQKDSLESKTEKVELQQKQQVHTDTDSQNGGNVMPPTAVSAEVLQNLPQDVRAIAEGNPHLFWKLLQTKQEQAQLQRSQQSQSVADITRSVEGFPAEVQEETNDEMAQLIPGQAGGPSAGSLRIRPGF